MAVVSIGPMPEGFNLDQAVARIKSQDPEFWELVAIWRSGIEQSAPLAERAIAFRDMMAIPVSTAGALMTKLQAMLAMPGGANMDVHGHITAGQVIEWDAERVCKMELLNSVT